MSGFPPPTIPPRIPPADNALPAEPMLPTLPPVGVSPASSVDAHPRHGYATPPPPIRYLSDDIGEPSADSELELAEEAPPRPLLATRPLRLVAIGANIASVPVALAAGTDPSLAMLATLVAAVCFLALVAWSGTVVSNVGRARAANQHHQPPRPIVAAGSWFIAPALAVPGWLLLYRLDQWVEDAPFDQQADRSVMFGVAVIAFSLCLLVAMYQPYRVLGRASRWINGDSAKFRRWFVAPFVGGFVGGLLAVAVTLAMAAGEPPEVGDPSIVAAAGVWVLGAALPWLAWLICASRAMIDLEEAVGHQHRRLTGEGLNVVMPMNPLMVPTTRA
jgi:hypothetical protein